MAKILIIDDDPDIVMAVRLCLRSAGHEVFDASNSERGLRLLDEIRPDLIILDVMMDTATEGFQTALQLRRPDPADGLLLFLSPPPTSPGGGRRAGRQRMRLRKVSPSVEGDPRGAPDGPNAAKYHRRA